MRAGVMHACRGMVCERGNAVRASSVWALCARVRVSVHVCVWHVYTHRDVHVRVGYAK